MVRHAEVHNPQDILYGRLPRFRLSRRGRDQAEATARFLASRPVSVIYTSPLLRARQTAEILRHYHSSAPIRTASGLLEVRTSYQGSPNSILKPGFSFFEPVRDRSDETIEDVWQRMARFLRIAAGRHAAGTVAAVSHADPISIMRVGLEGLPLSAKSMHDSVYAARSSVTEIVIGREGPTSLTYFNVAEVSELKL